MARAGFGSPILTSLGALNNPERVVFGDFNGDKKVDVMVMNRGTINYTVLLNTGK